MVLSLDVTAPFHDAMAVPVDKAFCITSLREIIERGRAEHATDEAVMPPLAERLLERIAVERGADVRSAFVVWMRDTFSTLPLDQPQLGAYKIVFFEWATDKSLPAVLAAHERFVSLIEAYRSTLDRRTLLSELDGARATAVQGWDLEMFARHRVYDDDGVDPFLFVETTVETVRFRRFWTHLCETLDAEEKTRVRDAAQRVLQRMGISTPGTLVAPDLLSS